MRQLPSAQPLGQGPGWPRRAPRRLLACMDAQEAIMQMKAPNAQGANTSEDRDPRISAQKRVVETRHTWRSLSRSRSLTCVTAPAVPGFDLTRATIAVPGERDPTLRRRDAGPRPLPTSNDAAGLRRLRSSLKGVKPPCRLQRPAPLPRLPGEFSLVAQPPAEVLAEDAMSLYLVAGAERVDPPHHGVASALLLGAGTPHCLARQRDLAARRPRARRAGRRIWSACSPCRTLRGSIQSSGRGLTKTT